MTPIELSDLTAICLTTAREKLAPLVGPLNAAMEEFEINTPARQAHFLAQLAHESGCFRYMRELASGEDYEGREDLGNTELGDGHRFRGWGWMQTTGRKNTRIVSMALFGDDRLVRNPMLIDPPTVVLSARAAGHFWTVGAGQNLSKRAIAHGVPIGVNLNDLADAGDVEGITYAVNGWLNGYEDRRAFLVRGQAALA